MFRYRLQLFQIKEVNEETIRRANMCSTRMGRVQQTLSECSAQVERFEQLLRFCENNLLTFQNLRPSALAAWNNQLEEMGRQITELERHILQAELAMAGLEKLDEERRKCTDTSTALGAGDGGGSEEELLGQL